jgi:hypothetical protein
VRRRPDLPSGTLGVRCTDAPGGWQVAGTDGRVDVVGHDPSVADAVVTGPAGDLLLHLWGRPAGPIRRDGDHAVADAWLTLGAV